MYTDIAELPVVARPIRQLRNIRVHLLPIPAYLCQILCLFRSRRDVCRDDKNAKRPTGTGGAHPGQLPILKKEVKKLLSFGTEFSAPRCPVMRVRGLRF